MMWHSILELLPQKDAWKLGRLTLFVTCGTAYIKTENLPSNPEVDYVPWHVFTFCDLRKIWRIDLELLLKSWVTQMLPAVFKKGCFSGDNMLPKLYNVFYDSWHCCTSFKELICNLGATKQYRLLFNDKVWNDIEARTFLSTTRQMNTLWLPAGYVFFLIFMNVSDW